MQTRAREQAEDVDFAAWLESPVIEISLSRRHGQWYAVARDLAIAGIGETEGAAYRDVAGLVEAYLRSCFTEGISYRAAVQRRASGQRPRSPRAIYRFIRRHFAAALPTRRGRAVVLPIAARDLGSAH